MCDQRLKTVVYVLLSACAILISAQETPMALAADEKKFNELVDEAEKQPVRDPVKSVFMQRPALEYTSEGLRDPFLNYLPVKDISQVRDTDVDGFYAKLHTLRVEGIIWGSSMPQAIVNNRVIKVGDQLEGASVSSIDKSGITLIMDDREYKLGPPSAGPAAVK